MIANMTSNVEPESSFDHLFGAGKQRVGTVSPECLPVLRLITSSYLVLYRQVTRSLRLSFQYASFPPSTYRRGPDFIFKERQ
jgi:hypothetical protein